MPTHSWTAQQRQAIESLDGSVLVSAAAGSGKTAVLAERCAHLVCDAPPEKRCDITGLLVLTFTEAAAAEMRSRIVESIRGRAALRPHDPRLREQAALADTAAISTIHAFCLWLVRRWFSVLEVDPNAVVLDADEAGTLRREVLAALFDRFYREANSKAEGLERAAGPEVAMHRLETGATPEVHPLKSQTADTVQHPSTAGLAEGFIRLVDDYGLGQDRSIAEFVLRLAEFAASLPDPEAWLTEAHEALVLRPDSLIQAFAHELSFELNTQIEECASECAALRRLGEVTRVHVEQIDAYRAALEEWAQQLRPALTPALSQEETETSVGSMTRPTEGMRRLKTKATIDEQRPSAGDTSESLERARALGKFEETREKIVAFEFDKRQGPRLPADVDSAVRAARELATERRKRIRDVLLGKRLKERFGAFSVAEQRAGLARVAPYVEMLTRLVRSFAEAYGAEKRRRAVLDFSDLERLAYRLLCDEKSPHPGTLPKGEEFALTPTLSQGERELRQQSDENAGVGTARTEVRGSLMREQGAEEQCQGVDALLRRRFAHVLVDEFQDISPIQQAIIERVSRESDPAKADNLFTVGDVKQSIYRFRLAEPRLFTERLRRFRDPRKGRVISLQSNFRSRREILRAVNGCFRHLMRTDTGDIAYDEEAELRPGRESTDPGHHPVEIHLVERQVGSGGEADEGEEPGIADSTGPEGWEVMEREAYLIGTRIRRMVDGEGQGDGTFRYRDIVILVRAARVQAERMSGILSAMGIPSFAEAGGSLLEAMEVRDVLALLHVLDNAQQDIPLASVLRSGILGPPLSGDELAAIRHHERTAPFHRAVQTYARDGGDVALRERVAAIVRRIDHFREAARMRPLSEVLWEIYERHGYLTYAAGLPRGTQRYANLIKLHELTRKFGEFRRQGLHRFLRFLEAQRDAEQGIATAAPLGEGEDVVRIMTIHHSKGLEFPVVFVAGLGTRLNLGDRSGPMIHERRHKIGLRVVDPERLISYPTTAHALVALEVERSTREEELRVLYVAMTRARERLILVGSIRNAAECLTDVTLGGRPTRLSVIAAQTPLDWILPAVAAEDPESIMGGRPKRPGAIYQWHIHDAEEILGWRLTAEVSEADAELRRAVARAEPLPKTEPIGREDGELRATLTRIEYVYPLLPLAGLRSTVGASQVKGAFDFLSNPEWRAETVPAGAATGGAARGIATHRVLQHLDYQIATDGPGLARELQRMVDGGLLAQADRGLLDEGSLVWFLGTPLAARIREAGPAFRREFAYMAGESPQRFDPSLDCRADDYVLVRGIVDGILPTGNGVEVIDFKTDAIGEDEMAERAERYRAQVELYSRAVSRLWARPVSTAWLVFLAARKVVSLV